MHIGQIRRIAKQMGIPAVGTKVELIRSIQRKEGNFDCFGTAVDGYCDQYNCLWRADCLKPPKRKSS